MRPPRGGRWLGAQHLPKFHRMRYNQQHRMVRDGRCLHRWNNNELCVLGSAACLQPVCREPGGSYPTSPPSTRGLLSCQRELGLDLDLLEELRLLDWLTLASL